MSGKEKRLSRAYYAAYNVAVDGVDPRGKLR